MRRKEEGGPLPERRGLTADSNSRKDFQGLNDFLLGNMPAA